jgi:KDO2-lipid IV(A) lauroyltransferase
MKNIEYFFLKIIDFVFSFLPLKICCWSGSFISRIAFWILPKYRKLARKNISESFPHWSALRVDLILKKMYRQLGRNLGEFFYLSRFDSDWLFYHVEFQNQEMVDAVLKKGRGVIALVAHFGNWELHGTIWAKRGYSLKVIAFPQSNKRVDQLIREKRESSGMQVIYTGHQGTRDIIAHLKMGGVVGMLADQNAGDSGLRLSFLGRPCSVSKAPAAIARKTHAALFPTFLLRKKNSPDRFINVVLPEIIVPETDNVEHDILTATQNWVKAQENFIKKNPDHYFWFHRRWKHYENNATEISQ